VSGPLEGRVALVTGGAGAIGSGSAARLASDGAAVAVADLDPDAAAAVAASITAAGGRATGLELDVSSEDSWLAALASTTKQLGPVTVLHSNAAATSPSIMARDSSVTEMDVELWDLVMGVNVRGAMLGCKHTIPGMIAAGGGSIVVTVSVAAFLASLRTAYTTSKGALVAFTRSVATVYGPQGIRCNAIAPGFVESAATANLSPADLAGLSSANRLPDPGQSEDIAAVVAFLASDEARFMTGQLLVADGGMSIHLPSIHR
jgi:NAD(P)-dependent dehydrogenase (short-subunit alcohol dehydrogenase family)